MSCSVHTFSIIVLLIVGLLSMDGTKGDYQKIPGGMDITPFLNTSIGKFIFKVETSHDMKFNGLTQDNLREIQEIKQKEQVLTDLEGAEGQKLMRELQHIVMGRQQPINDIKPDQEFNLRYQLLTNVETKKKRKVGEQFQYLEEKAKKNPSKSLANRFLLRMIDRASNFGSNLALLWRRGDEQSAETNISERDRQKTKESHSHSGTTSKLRVMFHPITDVISKTKDKRKPNPLTAGSFFKKTTKLLSIGSREENSAKSGLDTGLTSGFTSKPSGFGIMTPEYPSEGISAPYQEASRPRDQTQTFKRKVSRLLHRNSRGADDAEVRERSPPRSPSMGTEKNHMWDYIHRVSKKWGENEHIPAPNEDLQQPEETQPIHSLDSQSSGWTKPNFNQDGKRIDFLLAPAIQSSTDFQSPNIRTVETKEVTVDQEDKNIIDYIINCKKGWFSPKVAPVTDEHNELPTDSLPSPTRSPTGPPARSSPLFAIRHPSSTRSSPSHQSPSSMMPNIQPDPRQQLRQLSNKEINDGYTTLLNKLKSSDRLGQISEE